MTSSCDQKITNQIFQSLYYIIFIPDHDVGGRRRYVFDILKYIRLPLVPLKRLDEFQAQCADLSLQVALNR